jgi:TRAP-type C4-dicarboxylate transport system permease small subunit
MENMKKLYARAMEWLYIGCISVAGVVIVAMVIIIPYGVFMRYVMNSPSSWPEPAGVLLMVVFSFIGGSAAYRARAHIAVTTLLNALGDQSRARTEFVAEIGMAIVAVFMIKWGILLVRATWFNSIAEFPGLSSGVTYMPIPVAGVVLLLFVIERLWCGEPSSESFTFRDQPQSE